MHRPPHDTATHTPTIAPGATPATIAFSTFIILFVHLNNNNKKK